MQSPSFSPTNFIQRMKECYNFSVSTDVCGIFGNWQDAQKFWLEVVQAFNNKRDKEHNVTLELPGIEVLLWTHTQPWHLLTHTSPLPVSGFHGRTGVDANLPWTNPIRLLTTLFAFLLQSTPRILYALASHPRNDLPRYLLLHETEIVTFLNSPALLAVNPYPFAIENNPIKGSQQRVISIVRSLEKMNIPVIPVFDVVHFLLEEPNGLINPSTCWQSMCNELSKIGPCIVHLSLGTNDFDSLPLSLISESMWESFATVMHEEPHFLVIEYQRAELLQKIRSTPVNDAMFIERTIEVLEVLSKYRLV